MPRERRLPTIDAMLELPEHVDELPERAQELLDVVLTGSFAGLTVPAEETWNIEGLVGSSLLSSAGVSPISRATCKGVFSWIR